MLRVFDSPSRCNVDGLGVAVSTYKWNVVNTGDWVGQQVDIRFAISAFSKPNFKIWLFSYIKCLIFCLVKMIWLGAELWLNLALCWKFYIS